MTSLHPGWFESILTHLDEGVTVQDATGRLRFANHAACRLIGFDTPEELLATPPAEVLARFEVFDERGAPFSFADLPGRKVLAEAESEPRTLRFRLRDRPSEDRWSVVRAVPIRGPDGRVELAVNLFHDVTRRRKQDEALRLSQEWLSTTLTSIGDAVVATDAQGVVQFTNPVADALTGWDGESAIGRPLREVFHIVDETHGLPVDSPVERVIRDDAVVGLADHTLLVRRDGQRIPIDDSAAPIRSRSGALVGVVLVFRDVSERRRAEIRREFLARAADELSSSLDYHHTLATVARLAVPHVSDWCAVDVLEEGALRRLAVAHVDPAKVQLVHDLARRHPADPETDVVWRIVRTGEPEWLPDLSEGALERLARDPEHLATLRTLGLTSFIAVPITRRGEPVGVLSFAAAESSRRFTEEDLAVAQALADRASVALKKAWLYREQQAARAMLERARAQAEQANRTKDEFLAMLGHELRNPLGPILTALEVLRMRGVPGIDRERDIIDRQVRHVTRLVDDLLDLARITRGKLQIAHEPLRLGDAVRQAVEQVSPLLERQEHPLTVEVPEQALVSGDHVRLVQVVGNLLTNAALYSDRRAPIRIEAERTGDQWALSVVDRGRGVPADLVERIFEPFVQDAQASDRARGGLGLGLAIARRLVEIHGGTLSASSPGVGRGSTFTVRLPALDAQDLPAGLVDGPSVASRQLRLLVVDDNEDARETLAMALEIAGHRVDRAADGPSALDQGARHPPDLAVLDIGLPVMDGYELAQRLRREQPGVRLVALTGYGQDHDRQRAAEAGFDEHLVKPVAIDTLLDAIERLTSGG